MKLPYLFSGLIVLMMSVAVQAQEEMMESPAAVETEEYLDSKYVTDKLRLSLYKEPRGNSETLRLLTSGDLLYVMERKGPYSRVKTEDDLEGWVKNGFLVNEPTANIQLAQSLTEIEQLNLKMEQYSDTESMVAEYESNLQSLGDQKMQSDQQVEQLQLELQQLHQQQQQLQQQLDDAEDEQIDLDTMTEVAKQLWYFLAAGLLLFFLIGLIIGKSIIAAQVRKRFQGIKVW